MQATVALAERAGIPVWIPEDVAGNCCATPYSSKGFEESRDAMLNRVIENFWSWSSEGHLPIMVDTSPMYLWTPACARVSDAGEPAALSTASRSLTASNSSTTNATAKLKVNSSGNIRCAAPGLLRR
jgi:hypothetical protein